MNLEIKTQPGEKFCGTIDLSVGKERVSLPLFIIHGKESSPTLCITAGIHGTEYSSIEAALRLGKSLQPQEIRGKVMILPVANMPSFMRRTIYVGPYDGKNLNRVFPGKEDGTFSEVLAYQIFHGFIKKGDYFIDLHGGDMNEALVPFIIHAPSGNPKVDQVSLSMAESFGIEIVVKRQKPGTTLYSATRAGIPALVAEVGGQGILNEDAVGIHFTGVKRVMAKLGFIQGEGDRFPIEIIDFPWIFSDYDGVFYSLVKVGEKVSAGQKMGVVCDFFGKELQVIRSPSDATILFMVTSLAINKEDPLFGIGC